MRWIVHHESFFPGFFLIQSIWAQEGDHGKPSLSAWPSPGIPQGQHVTLWSLPSRIDRFRLHKGDRTNVPELQVVMFWKDFLVGAMTEAHAGTHRRHGQYGHLPPAYSQPLSDLLNTVVTGLSRKPSLSAQGGPMLRSGENVTLVCSSESAFDQLHLLRERGNLGRGPRGALQAEFPLGPGTPAHRGVCRCCSSFTRSPYSWSDSSDPLFLSVTGSTTSTCPSTMDPHTTEEARLPQGHSSQLHLLLRLSVAFIYTSIFLAVLVCHWLPIKCFLHGRRAQGRQTVNGKVDPPRPNPCPKLSPSNAECPSLRKSHLIPSFTSPSSQDPSRGHDICSLEPQDPL
ncbi:killer cell immunoglobulin-like receptor 2DL4 [Ovis aries]|uniref:killer cell immunoglobulin-like receptor 2DL4 n=1 Tax=Ovis aries TaxID=9940 RepID=UPI001C2E7C87|nr:killer cell immunoglobulin-like receptor 2DL4 [Ovis aries]